MASKITIKRSQTAATPAGLSYGEIAFVQGSGLTANQLYMGISGGNPVWVGAQIGTTGTWTDNAAKTSLATQYATDQRIILSTVSSFNGATGAITGVSSFNGATGAVTGASLGANTFTALNTFSAGISASGATFTGSISGATATFSKDITVNSITVGRGGGAISSNIAVGENALYFNTTGEGNFGVGEVALYNNTEGSGNVGVGASALYNNTTGNYNVGVGYAALNSNTEGNYNIGVGEYALGLNTTGSSNVGVGEYALGENTTGSGNVGVGEGALLSNTTGSNKTAIGYLAGYYRGTAVSTLTTGTGGIYIGYKSRGSTLAQTNEIVIGVNALGLGSNTAVIGATLQSAATIYGVLNLPSGLSASGATFSGNISAPNIVSSFNGATGAVTGVSRFNGATGAITGVSSFNGATGAVTGASLGANTFTALQSFSAGISASGATFTGLISGATATFSKDITVNSMTVGRGGGGNSSNVAVGLDAFASNTEGSCNVGVGRNALTTNTTGSGNVGVGRNALTTNTTGSGNVGVGVYALGANESGSNKTAIGYGAGDFIGTGTDSNATGTGGIYIGYQARGSTNDQTNEIVIGVDALGLGSHTAVIGATLQSAATIYGVLNLPSGLSAAGGTTAATFNGTVDMNFNTLFEPTLRYYNEVLASPSITANVLTLDLSTAQMFTVSLNANITTFTISNTPATANRSIGFTLIFTADGTARTVTWGAAVKWANNDPPALTSTNAKKDILSFVSPDGGTTWYGFIGGLNF